MSSLTTAAPRSRTAPYGIYAGPRTGDEFLEWNMGEIKRRIAAACLRRDGRPCVVPHTRPGTGMGAFDLVEVLSLGQAPSAALPALLKSVAGEAVQAIELNTQLTGPIVIQKPFSSDGKPAARVEGGFAKILMPFLKPGMYAYTPGGGRFTLYEPNGAPQDYSTAIGLGLGLAMGGAALTGLWLGKKACQKVVRANSGKWRVDAGRPPRGKRWPDDSTRRVQAIFNSEADANQWAKWVKDHTFKLMKWRPKNVRVIAPGKR